MHLCSFRWHHACAFTLRKKNVKKKITISQSALNYCYMTEVLNLVGDFRRYYAMCSLLITSAGLPCLSIKVSITHAVSVWDCCIALFCKLLHVFFLQGLPQVIRILQVTDRFTQTRQQKQGKVMSNPQKLLIISECSFFLNSLYWSVLFCMDST